MINNIVRYYEITLFLDSEWSEGPSGFTMFIFRF